MPRAGVLLTLIAIAGWRLAAQETHLARIGGYVEGYYSRAQSIVAEETVLVQPLAPDLTADGLARRAIYEVRVEWNPAADDPSQRATAVRQLIKATGPALFDPDQEECADPPSITPEPLAFLLPSNQERWNFEVGKGARLDGRRAVTIDYRPRVRRPPVVIADADCLYTDLSGQTAGRLWVDEASAEILRLDEHLLGLVDVRIPREHQKRDRPIDVTYERVNSTVRYKPVKFADPEETLLLPASIETVQVHRSFPSGISRLRLTQTFANYRRFVTGSRIVH